MEAANVREHSIFTTKSQDSESYWSFKGRSKREHCHKLLTYPAMMVPQMQGELIDELLEKNEDISIIYDPFVGSGTTLVESILRGKSFIGTDINPLAILCCEVKADPFYKALLEQKIDDLIYRLSYTTKPKMKHHFKEMDKWFLNEVQQFLNIIRECIKAEPTKWARRFFWLALAETAREFCNSRPTTFKLHIKAEKDLILQGNPINFFKERVNTNFNLKKELFDQIAKMGYSQHGKLKNKTRIAAADTRKFTSPKKTDLIVTSPPYGDNQTTVTYGQFSFLPLKWIDIKDLKERIDPTLLNNQSAIDAASLGGSKRNWKLKVTAMKNMSESFASAFDLVASKNKKGESRLTAFTWDLYLAYKAMSRNLRLDGYLMITLGNRRISEVEIPLDKISQEILNDLGFSPVNDLKRKILNKRMAKKNNHSETMSSETVLIMKKLK